MSDLPDPTPGDLDDPQFEAIWQVIKTWDVSVDRPAAGFLRSYSGATGSHVMLILNAIRKVDRDFQAAIARGIS